MYEIYERLLELKGVTTADVCRATGLKESSISNWKHRGTSCSHKTAAILANYFDVTIDYLMTGKDTLTPNNPSLKPFVGKVPYYNDEVFTEYMNRVWYFPKDIRKKVYEYIDLLSLDLKNKKETSSISSNKAG